KTASRSWLCGMAIMVLFVAVRPDANFSQNTRESLPRMVAASTHTDASCELAGVLDEFTTELKDDPESFGYVVLHSGQADLPGRLHRHALGVQTVRVAKGLDPARLVIVIAEAREEFSAEYRIASKNSLTGAAGQRWNSEIAPATSGKFDELLWEVNEEGLN